MKVCTHSWSTEDDSGLLLHEVDVFGFVKKSLNECNAGEKLREAGKRF